MHAVKIVYPRVTAAKSYLKLVKEILDSIAIKEMWFSPFFLIFFVLNILQVDKLLIQFILS